MEKKLTLNKLISYVLSIEYKDNDILSEPIINNDISFSLIDLKNQITNNKQNITNIGNKLKEILDPFYKNINRIGTIHYFPNSKLNISLFYTILAGVYENYLKLSIEGRLEIIEFLNKKLINDITELYETYEYEKLEWTIKDIKESLIKYKNDKILLRLLSDYFNINIILLNVNEDKLYAIYGEENYNQYKPTILTTLFNECYEILEYNNKLIWYYNTEPLKKIITVEKLKIHIYNYNLNDPTELNFKIGSEDLTKYLPDIQDIPENIQNINEVYEIEKKENDDIIVEDTIVDSEITLESTKNEEDIFYKYKKNKISERDFNIIKNPKTLLSIVQEYAEKYNINILKENSKKKTKKELIDELNKLR